MDEGVVAPALPEGQPDRAVANGVVAPAPRILPQTQLAMVVEQRHVEPATQEILREGVAQVRIEAEAFVPDRLADREAARGRQAADGEALGAVEVLAAALGGQCAVERPGAGQRLLP